MKSFRVVEGFGVLQPEDPERTVKPLMSCHVHLIVNSALLCHVWSSVTEASYPSDCAALFFYQIVCVKCFCVYFRFLRT